MWCDGEEAIAKLHKLIAMQVAHAYALELHLGEVAHAVAERRDKQLVAQLAPGGWAHLDTSPIQGLVALPVLIHGRRYDDSRAAGGHGRHVGVRRAGRASTAPSQWHMVAVQGKFDRWGALGTGCLYPRLGTGCLHPRADLTRPLAYSLVTQARLHVDRAAVRLARG